MRSQYLSKTEATMLVAGAGIGTGIFTLPAAIAKVGIWGMLIAVTPAFIISLLLYYMIADLALLSCSKGQLLAILKEHLFRGRFEKPLTVVFFILLVAILLENLIIYILCAANYAERV